MLHLRLGLYDASKHSSKYSFSKVTVPMIVLSLPMKRYVVAALVGLLSLLINAGCSPSTSLLDDWSDYQQRLATPQQLEPKNWQLAPAPAYPARRELRLELPPIQLSLLDSLRLDDCRAGALIAER